MRVSCVAVLLPRLLSVATRSQQVWPRKSGSQSSFNCLFGHCGAILLDRLTGRYVYMSRSLMSSANLGGEAVASTSSGSSSKSHVSYGHDRQPSVQLKIEASGGPPLSGRKENWITKSRRTWSYFFSQLIVLLSQLSPIVQSLSCMLILLYLIQFGGDITIDFFALTPGEIISPGQWYHTVISIWSHPFLETRFYLLVIDLLILSFCGTLIEPLWGHKEVLRFICITCIPSALLTSIHYILLYCITTNDTYLFNVRIYGFMPFCAAVAVTVKQLLPQSILIATSFGRLKNDHIPFTTFVLVVLFYLLNMLSAVQVIMFSYGVLTSWFYLRFLQPHTRHPSADTTTITRGDLSDAFAFDTFFPNVFRPVISIISIAIYNCLVRLGLCPKIPSPAVQLLNESANYRLADSTRTFKYTLPQYHPGARQDFLNGSTAHLLEPTIENL